MRLRHLGTALLAAGLACSDSTAPDRSDRYEWWIVDGIDTLTFHWLPAELPVKIWVEDSDNLPAQISRGMDLWHSTLGSNWRAVTVTDSTTADVIVREGPIGQPAPAMFRSPIPSGSCQGETVVDTVTDRFQLAIPIRINIEIISGSADSIQACLRRVAAHELGHSLGLFQHSGNADDLMYPFPEVDAPSTRDANTAITLYATPRNMAPIRPPVATPAR